MTTDLATRRRRPAARRLLVALAALSLGAGGLAVSGAGTATGSAFPAATPTARCGPGSLPETGLQGQVPTADHESGRAARGYRCNTRLVARHGRSGGFKVQRYVDRAGRTCAYYDSTRLFPADTLYDAAEGQGVVVLDMADPARPRRTSTLETPAMLSPHESVLVNQRRGLLAAVMGNPYASAGVLDVYDLRADCRRPRLLSSTPVAVLGHESGFAPDGRTFYAASSGGNTFTAIDLSAPAAPVPLLVQHGVNYHGMRLSDDGRTMYVAHISNDLSGGTLPGEGLRILDVSEVQDREPDPQVEVLADLVWPERSIPQVAQPFRRAGREYLLQVDEFSRVGLGPPEEAPVGAARIIDVTEARRPRVVSALRLQVHQPAGRRASIGDPGASSPTGGYTAHYCSVPTRRAPALAACAMIGSGLRVFDIRDPRRPREVAYYNLPVPGEGASALAEPAWDAPRRTIWFTDTNRGFLAVRLTNGVGRLLRR